MKKYQLIPIQYLLNPINISANTEMVMLSSHHGPSLGQRSPETPEKGDGLRKEREEEDDDR